MNDQIDAPPLGDTHRSLRELVADAIRERIVTGRLAPGQRLVERTLGEELGVSRVPIRDALNVLKGEGYVTAQPRRGVFVTQLSRQDIAELFDVREALEVLAVRLATEQGTDAEVRRLRRVVQEADRAIAASDTPLVGRCNQKFHDLITTMAHNALLASLLEPLEGRLHWLLRQNDDPHVLHQEHTELCEAIASRDVERAAAQALAHVRTSREICLAMVAAQEVRLGEPA